MTEIILKDLPKISLNQWYAGKHWTTRKKQKDNYVKIVKSQFKHIFSKNDTYVVDYEFNFKNRPLDSSNCVSMVKLIEDIIFENDSYKIVKKISISSIKNKSDFAKIKVTKL